MKTKPLYLAVAVMAALSQSSLAYEVTDKKKTELPNTKLESVTVRLVVPSNVQNLTKKDLKESATQNIEDIVMYEPGVDVATDNMRLGHQSFSIRGIDGNRILMTVDGVPLPDEQRDLDRAGTVAVSTRDTIETDTLKTVQIVKGGNGTAQGDGAVGGAVNMQTFVPLDFVGEEKNWHSSIKYGYRSTYRSHGVTATAAAKHDALSSMIMLSKRKMHEAENYTEKDSPELTNARTKSNDQDTTQDNILFKVGVDGDNHNLIFTAERFKRYVETEQRQKQGAGSSFGTPTMTPISSTGNIYKRNRLALDYKMTPASGLDQISLSIYHQRFAANDSSVNYTESVPTKPGQQVRSVKNSFDNSYSQNVRGIRPEFAKSFKTGLVQHNMIFGLEHRLTDTSRLIFQDYDSSTRGLSQNTAAYFPPAKRKVTSLYVQDSLSFPNGTNIGLGLRFEQEKSKFDFDNQSHLVTTVGVPVKFDETNNRVLLPSVGITFPIVENLTGSVAYRRGYRSADVNYVAAGFNNPNGKYRIIPNPDLKPESSDNFEARIGYRGSKFIVSGTAFYHKYSDFISMDSANDQELVPPYTRQFRYSNVAKARTFGLEGKFAVKLTDALRATASVAWIDGKNKTDNQPLASGYPINGNVGLDYKFKGLDLGAKVRFAAKNKKTPKDARDNNYFQAPGHAVVDLIGNYEINNNLSISAGVYNVLNRKYWLTGDTKGVADNNQKDRFTQPGRNFAIGAELKF